MTGAAGYANVPNTVGALVSRRYATLRELQEYYSYEDALDMLEVLRVADYNAWAVNDWHMRNVKK